MTKPSETTISKGYLNTIEAGEYLRLSSHALRNMRITGNGPLYRKHGKLVVYAMEDLKAWSDSLRKSSTSDA
ncbi:helix-turn-helix domain-containing protein [Paremcibacter congregatus]|uniref:DNA-binding protein n=1 Tax=Paremcibacter congregatus TaxID=2043170 RepID=A0A2G4YZ81_9PROT|nr:helix-turn-helix domain-containing protein [Paremcibacter congregatus]PHZ86766.1 DNA-binding protein [Paremcibacter congregatus]QDE26272.1 helix-turn-helix domain-containing protein [Paremcibacter congregatus]QDE28021.1 helix-turn-helix domain-containing protein [Paremcibacter congregatus]